MDNVYGTTDLNETNSVFRTHSDTLCRSGTESEVRYIKIFDCEPTTQTQVIKGVFHDHVAYELFRGPRFAVPVFAPEELQGEAAVRLEKLVSQGVVSKVFVAGGNQDSYAGYFFTKVRGTH